MNKKIYIILIILFIAAVGTGIYFYIGSKNEKIINNFEDCIKMGYPVLESYPRQCVFKGQNFTEDIGNELGKTDLIKINFPRPNQEISSPLEISGEARGYWFFEASFPIRLYDENNNEIAVVVAQAQSEWMTEDFVPYKAILEFKKPQTRKGFLVLEKDNPSGLPEFEDELIVPIYFK